ncbi:hypothetical protein [Psychroserpens sp.]|uniref:hypothetical protein n=1 Tax=Psychroserpens sp. TaxID=2020870 RepID=UPI00385816C5
MLKPFFFLIIISLFQSCNNSSKSSPKESQTIQVQPKSLSIEFSFKTSQADEFKIMMNNITVDELQKKNIHIFEDVVPSTSDDVIVANFDPENLSKEIFCHLGNKVEKEVTIKGVLITYGDKQFNLTSTEDFNKHLDFNKFIERDSTSNKLSTKRVGGKLNPWFRIKNSLINQLQR